MKWNKTIIKLLSIREACTSCVTHKVSGLKLRQDAVKHYLHNS